MKATGIVRRIDDLQRVVIPKEIRRTLRIHDGNPPHTILTFFDKFCIAIHSVINRCSNIHLEHLSNFKNNVIIIHIVFGE